MNLNEVLSMLESIRPETADVRSRVEERGGQAGMVLERDGHPEQWATVSTPGSGWFSLQLDGGYMYDLVDEDASPDEIRQILQRLVSIGLAYLHGASEIQRSRWFREPIRVVQLGGERIRIGHSLDSLWRRTRGTEEH